MHMCVDDRQKFPVPVQFRVQSTGFRISHCPPPTQPPAPTAKHARCAPVLCCKLRLFISYDLNPVPRAQEASHVGFLQRTSIHHPAHGSTAVQKWISCFIGLRRQLQSSNLPTSDEFIVFICSAQTARLLSSCVSRSKLHKRKRRRLSGHFNNNNNNNNDNDSTGIMLAGPTIAALFLTVWCIPTRYTVLYTEATQSESPVRARGIGSQQHSTSQPGFTSLITASSSSTSTSVSTSESDSNSLSSSRRLDPALSAPRQQNDIHFTGLAHSDVAFQDDYRSRGTKRHANVTSSPSAPGPDIASKPDASQVSTSNPTKPPRRKKSVAPTSSPTLEPQDDDAAAEVEDDAVEDDTVPDASEGPAPADSPAADTDAPVAPPPPVPPPTPLPTRPVPQTRAPSVARDITPRTPVPVNIPTQTKIATPQPMAEYVPIDDDPIVSQEIQIEEKKEEVELEHVETEAKTAGGIGFLLAIFAMIFTAHQMSENPDGIYASVCRLAITVIGCALKLILMPCRNFMGNRYHAGHIPVSTMEYREPYRGGNSAMEMT